MIRKRIKSFLRYCKFWKIRSLFRLITDNAKSRQNLTWEIQVLDDYATFNKFKYKRQGSALNFMKICWVVPSVSVFGGGFKTISRFANALGELGIEQEIAICDVNPIDLISQRRIWRENIKLDSRIGITTLKSSYKSDVILIATGWQTVYKVCTLTSISNRVWFMQDDESQFFSTGSISEILKAANIHFEKIICAGDWLESVSKERGSEKILKFDFGFDPIYFKNSKYNDNQKNIVVYFQPSKPWRHSFLLKETVELFLETHKDWRAYLVGENIAGELKMHSRMKAVGNLSPSEMSYIYSKCSIGIVGSGTNASLVPYEMLASGLKVVSNKGLNAEWLHSGLNDVFISELSLLRLYEALEKASLDTPNGNDLKSWDEVISQFKIKVVDFLNISI